MSPDIFVEFAVVVVGRCAAVAVAVAAFVVVVVVGSDAGADGNASANRDCSTIFRAAAFVAHCATSEFGSSHQQDDN